MGPCSLQSAAQIFFKRRNRQSDSGLDKMLFSIEKKYVFVPANLVYFKSDWCTNDFSDTTGLASGNNIEEAILHAMCEVIERHVEDLVCWNRIKVPTVDIATISTHDTKKIINHLSSIGLKLKFSYLNIGFNIPVIRVFAYLEKTQVYPSSYSFYTSVGAHPNKDIAMLRALTEFAQTRASIFYKFKNKFDKITFCKQMPRHIFDFFSETIDNKRIGFDEVQSHSNNDILSDINLIIKILDKNGHEVIIKDLTHP